MKPQLLRLGLATGTMIWLAQFTGPLMQGGNINYVTAVVYFFIGLGGVNFVIELLTMVAWLFQFLSTREVTGKDGTAYWAKFRDVKPELTPDHSGPFWGVMK